MPPAETGRGGKPSAIRSWSASVTSVPMRAEPGGGSDLDLIAIVRDTGELFERRAMSYDLLRLPVPAELLVYTEAEWARLIASGSPFAERVQRETVWVHPPADG